MTSTASLEGLLAELHRIGVHLWEEGGQLRYRAPKGVLSPERLDALRTNKDAVIARLRAEDDLAAVTPDPAARYDPFPLTDVQAAYLLGRHDAFGYGGVACHVYLEINYPELDPARTEAAWNRLIDRHNMLRVVVEPDGYQRVLPTVPHLALPVRDLRDLDPGHVDEELAAIRTELDHKVHDTTRWPLFEVRLTQTPEHAILHLSIDFLVADWASIWGLLGEFETLHADPTRQLPPLDVTFRDYLIAERGLRETNRYQRDRDYWWARLDDLPAAPDLPVLPQTAEARFNRRTLRLDARTWEQLKHRTTDEGLTPSAVVLAAYAAVIQRWCGMPRFSLNVTVLNRLPLHPEIQQVVGDFTTVDVLAVDWTGAATFADRAGVIGAQLFEDLDHPLCTGVEVMRELARRRGREAALMPIVFTSAIGLGGAVEGERPTHRLGGYGITQTPQVFIDCQTMDDADGLRVNWDIRDGVFPDGVADDMFDAFESLLRGLATADELWRTDDVVALPRRQIEQRRAVNHTATALPTALLHEAILAQARRTPDSPALIGTNHTVSYARLVGWATAVADGLKNAGCAPGERVAVFMDKGVEQVAAVLGALLTGAVFVPIDTVQPLVRRVAMLADAGVRHVLTQSWLATGTDWPAATRTIAVDPLEPSTAAPPAGRVDADAAAYVIYTSGSTGRPKGVVISHRAASNTITDINRRFGVTAADRVLGVSNLGFDLSIYDIFGPLSVGGALVYPDADRRADPSHWAELLTEHDVTLWNSVPALMQMLTSYLRSEPTATPRSLRLVLLSGDWIPLALPGEIEDRVPGVHIISLGGATEAAIWSIHHPINGHEPGWASVPYGTPLANQGFQVLDPMSRDCPDWVAGELCISGTGLAQGYLGDLETTAERFITHPRDGQRLYRTGDRGRYRPGGVIEFLGRQDTQVKVRGHRIELGEIEAALQEHSAVAAACVVLDRTDRSDHGLLGVVETARHEPRQDAEHFARMASLVRAAADRSVPGISADQVETYISRLDDAMLSAMTVALRKLGMFATSETTHTAADIAAAVDPRHHWLLRRWLAVLTDAGHLTLDDGGRFALAEAVDDDIVARKWRDTEATAAGLGATRFLDYLHSNTEVLPALLAGEQDPVALLLPGGQSDTADALYRENAMVRYLNRAVSTVLHRVAAESADQFPLRILEVGAGTGATTETVLEVLGGFEVDYLFTDASPFFLPGARTRFDSHPGIRFGLFDVDTDYRTQGLTPNSFDIVLAAGVLENARDTTAALHGLRDLVAPGGWIVLTEPTREHPWILASQAFMMTPPEDAARTSGPSYLDRDQWLDLLARTGADEVLCLPDDDHALAAEGMHLFAARLKTDRVPVRAEELRSHLAERLPEPMLPAQLQVVDALPLSTNGKLDRATVQSWHTAATNIATSTTVDPPVDELEAQLAATWSEALAGPVGRSESLLERGADSLITARTVGRLRETVAAAADIPFDTLLRQMLNEPTVAALAHFLRQRAQSVPHVDDRPGASNAGLIRFGGTGDGPVRVMFHAGLGTMECFRPLAQRLVTQDLGPVVGIVIDDPETYCALDPAATVERLADDYTERLLNEGYQRFQLIGYCVGGLYAIEVARRLLERGIELDDLVLASSHPVLVDVEEDLMIETLFIPNLGITPSQLGFGPVDPDAAGRAFARVIEDNHGRVPAGSLVEVGGDPELDAVAAYFQQLGRYSQEDRFMQYANAASRTSGERVPPEMVSGMFRVLRQSFLSAHFRPAPYTEDIRFLLPEAAPGFAPGMDEATLSFWREVCLGEFTITNVTGNHFSCMEEPHVAQLAAHIAQPLRA